MSRPKPTILADYTNPKTYKAEQVLKADAIYAVYYDGKPFNLRTMNIGIDYPGPKYRRCAFPGNAGHAFNLAERLNTLMKTDKFHVYRLTGGERVEEHDGDGGEE